MDLDNKVRRFREIATGLADLYEKKNYNYGDSFGKLYNDLGPIAGLVPLHNKLDRATSLIKGNTNHFESLEDTLKDLASYAIMNLIEIEKISKGTQANDFKTIDSSSYRTVCSYPDTNVTITNGQTYVKPVGIKE